MTHFSTTKPTQAGVTLLELSIVLIVIGLIIGGVATGSHLIDSAQQRGAVAQFQEYDAAAFQFEQTYGALPGDAGMEQFPQFVARGAVAYDGDEDGLVEHWWPNYNHMCGEIVTFWSDLYRAELISSETDGLTASSKSSTGSGGGPGGTGCVSSALTPATVGTHFPKGKVKGTYITINSAGAITGGAAAAAAHIKSMGHIYVVQGLQTVAATGAYTAQDVIKAETALAIDIKIDDGLPTTGKVASVRRDSNTLLIGKGNYCYVRTDEGSFAATDDVITGDDTDAYNLGGTGYSEDACSLMVKANF